MESPWHCAADSSYSPTYLTPSSNYRHHERFMTYSSASVNQRDSGFFESEEVSSNPAYHDHLTRNYNGLLCTKRCYPKGNLEEGEEEPLRKRQKLNVIYLREIPSWNIYFNDQKHQLVKFADSNKRFRANYYLNKRVSLCFYKNVLTKLNIDAVVTSTTESYSGEAGVDKLIHEEAGKLLSEECSKLTRCEFGDAKITEGFMLPAKYIIHTNGPPVYHFGYEAVLQKSYENCLSLLVQKSLRTIAFPCISTGKKGIPKNVAAEVALSTIRRFMEYNIEKIDRVVLCLNNKKDIDIYLRLMQIYFPVE